MVEVIVDHVFTAGKKAVSQFICLKKAASGFIYITVFTDLSLSFT